MRFRTEIELVKAPWTIGHERPVLLLGSCFTDEIGSRLEADGFRVLRNPFGPLYNPASIARCLRRACGDEPYTAADLTEGPRGFHCLDYASRFSGPDAETLLEEINGTLHSLSDFISLRPVLIITLGSAYVYEYLPTGIIAGNCHKLPDSLFHRRLMGVDETQRHIAEICSLAAACGLENLIFTVSPIRHLAYGLHGNTLSKSTLQIALDRSVDGSRTLYFPSYEIMLDDLRDYRFYDSDMKHPSAVAADYIYEYFSGTFFTKDTLRAAAEARKAFLAGRHRQIL